MNYIISYDVVGLLLLALLFILNFSITKAPSRVAFFFRAIIICSFIGAFLDVFTVWTNHYTNTPALLVINNILAVLHIGFVGSSPLTYYLFVISFIYQQREIPRRKLVFTMILFGYDLATIITSPFTHLIMYYDDAGNYLHGPLFAGTYVIILMFVLAAVTEMITHFKAFSKKQFLIIFSYTIIDVAAAVIQFMHPEYLLLGFSSAISLMVVSFALKSPQELIDQNLGIFNRTAFKDFLFSRYNKGVMAIIHVNNAETIKYSHGLDNGYKILRKCLNHVIKECDQKLGFLIFNNTFVFINKNEEEAHQKLSILQKYKTEPMYIENDDHTKQAINIDTSVYLIKDSQFFQKVTVSSTRKNPLDQIIDILQFMVETNSGSSEIKVIGEDFIDYYNEKVRIQHIVDEAIKNESFEVFLQPIYDLKQKKFTGGESLIRLRDPDGKFISPGLFIPEAEKNGSILALGDISIKKTCEFIRDGKLLELGISKVNINLSMVQCMQDNIVDHLIELLDSYDIPKNMIRFEITETVTATNPDKLKDVMERLTSYGIEFALDDYGTGYSNTSRLLDFPFSEIKFDKSFVDSAMENQRNNLPLKYLMRMVIDSNMIVLVEGIETEDMSNLIEQYGGHLIQGFYYAKPLPLNDFVEFIKSKQ